VIQAPERTATEEPPEVPEAPPPEEQPRRPLPTHKPPAGEEAPKTWGELLTIGGSVFLSVAAAAWMSAGVFRGWLPRVVGMLGALIGVGIITFSFRSRRPAFMQYMVLPAALLLGAILVAPDAGGGTANLPGLVLEAIRTGGIAQPPIPFDPGWRFILVVLAAALGAAAAASSISYDRPKLGVFMPLPLLFGAALIQPKEAAVISSAVGLILLIGALAVSYGAELRTQGASSGEFELRRYVRGGGSAVVLVALLVIISRAGFLFPDRERNQVIPPKKPEVAPEQADRLLFTVESERPGPWRLGVLDVYKDNAWLLPPFDAARLVDVPGSGRIPQYPGAPGAAGDSKVIFTIADVQGHQIPGLESPQRLDRKGFEVQFDPRTQTFRLPEGRPRSGMTYTVSSPQPPSGEDLAKSPPPPESMKEFLDAPIPPNEIVTLLAEAPATNNWDRLQFVRNAFYSKVVASGAGEPRDVPATRVVEMLQGKEASPYEITAAETLLTRWAGIPARMGYGFYQGDKRQEGGKSLWQIRPKNGSTWLEAYFDGHGWIPVVGVPPRAKASLSEQKKQANPLVEPSEELALVVFVPVKLRTIRLLYVVVRFWFLVALPVVFVVALLAVFYTAPVKAARRVRRRRWASDDLRRRIAVAYSNFRDIAFDLNVGDPAATPLKFLESVDEDPEHAELAWLVTRALWGDLRRDLKSEDIESAEDMARSVTRRLRRAQPALARIIGAASRASLRQPFTREVPNLWPEWAVKGAVRKRFGLALRRVLSPLRVVRRLLPASSLFIAAMVLFVACAGGSSTPAARRAVLPKSIAPPDFQGFTIQREASAESAFKKVSPRDSLVTGGQVFTVRKGSEVLASIQVAAFKPGYSATRREVRTGVVESIGTGKFELTRIGGDRIYVKKLAEQSVYLWFPASGAYYELMVARKGFEDAARLFTSLIKFQRGEVAAQVPGIPQDVPDPRRGEDG
jgi:hypothetical protein